MLCCCLWAPKELKDDKWEDVTCKLSGPSAANTKAPLVKVLAVRFGLNSLIYGKRDSSIRSLNTRVGCREEVELGGLLLIPKPLNHS